MSEMFRALTLLAFALSAFAQEIRLSTTFSGDTLYLATPYPRAGTSDPPQGRIYTITPTGLSLFAERTREVLTVVPGQPQVTNYYSFLSPVVSADGRTLALTVTRQCVSGRNCTGVPLLQTELTGAVEMTVPNPVQFSPDGRWLVRFRTPGIGGAPGSLTDLATGADTPLSLFQSDIHPGSIVANNGSIVFDQAGLRLLPYGAQDPIQISSLLAEEATNPNLSADARLIVYSSAWNYPYHAYRRLRVADLATSELTTLIEGFANYYQPVLSHDARRVLFLADDFISPPQAHIISIDGAAHRRLTNDPSGISSAILSGDGRVAFALSRSGRLIRIGIDSNLETELLPPSLQIFSITALVAGSRVDIEALDDPNLRLYLNDLPLDLTRDAPNKFHFVLPFHLANQTLRLRAESTFPPGPFQPQVFDQDVFIRDRAPRAYDLPPDYGGPGPYGMRFSRVYDDNLSRLVTPFDPAGPGDIVNVLTTGLGPVLPATGELAYPLSCRWYSTTTLHPIDPIYAGLHPTEPGTYLLRFLLPQIPAQMTYEGALQITCSDGGRVTNDPVILIPIRR